MTKTPFTTKQIERMSSEIDAQLQALQADTEPIETRWLFSGRQKLPARQCQYLEQATGQAAHSFLEKFKKAAKEDLCQEGGVLYAQWQKWGDLTNEDVLKHFGTILVAMGFTGNALQVVAVALVVIVIHIGIKAFCLQE